MSIVVIAARAKEDVDFPIETLELAIDRAPREALTVPRSIENWLLEALLIQNLFDSYQ